METVTPSYDNLLTSQRRRDLLGTKNDPVRYLPACSRCLHYTLLMIWTVHVVSLDCSSIYLLYSLSHSQFGSFSIPLFRRADCNVESALATRQAIPRANPDHLRYDYRLIWKINLQNRIMGSWILFGNFSPIFDQYASKEREGKKFMTSEDFIRRSIFLRNIV